MTSPKDSDRTTPFGKQAKQRIKTFIKQTLLPKSFRRPTDKDISAVYVRLLARMPQADELLHWTISGTRIDDITNALILSYEYEQKKLNQQRVLVDVDDFKIYAMFSDAEVGRGIIQTKSHESHVTNAVKEVLKMGDVFIDLGANIGFFSLLAASIVQDSGKVISFEPNIQNLQLFYASIFENMFKNITVYPFAASNNAQILKLTSFGSNGFIETPQSSDTNAQFLQSVVVDHLLQNQDNVSVIKMDIEGYEPLALQGMKNIIKKFKPIVITEFSPWHIRHRTQTDPEDYLKQLTNQGYVLGIIGLSGGPSATSDTGSIMSYWNSLNNDKQHLDLIARPHTINR